MNIQEEAELINNKGLFWVAKHIFTMRSKYKAKIKVLEERIEELSHVGVEK